MADTPESVRVEVDWGREEIKKALDHAQEVGRLEGVDQGRREILDWLQSRYLGENSPDRGSPEAQAVLTLAREASDYLKKTRKV